MLQLVRGGPALSSATEARSKKGEASQGWLTRTSANGVGSVVLPRLGAGPALPSATAGEGQLLLLTLKPAFPPASGIEGPGGGIFNMYYFFKTLSPG